MPKLSIIKVKKVVLNMYLRPDYSLEHSIQLIRAEAVGVKAIKKVLNPQNSQSPQVLQRANTTCSQLEQHRRRSIDTLYRVKIPKEIKVSGSYLAPTVQDGGHRGCDTQQDLQHFGQVDVYEVAEFVDHHSDDVQQAVLTAQRQDGAQIRLCHRPFHCSQTGT